MLVQIHALFLDAVRQPLVRSGARRMNMPEAVVLALQLNKARHVSVHIQSAQAAPERNNQFFIVRQLHLLARLFTVCKNDFAAHRCAGQANVRTIFQQLARVLKTDEHAIRLLGTGLCHNARKGIDFKQNRRNMQLLCRMNHRIARIAAAAHDNIRLIFAQNLLCLCGRSQRLLQCGNVVQHRRRRHRTLEAAHVYGIQLIALTRHQLGFNARRCSGEANFYIIAAGLCIFCNGKTRIDMAARAAACNKQFHIKLPLFSSSLFFGWRNVS